MIEHIALQVMTQVYQKAVVSEIYATGFAKTRHVAKVHEWRNAHF